MITVTYNGLCVHLMEGFEITEIDENTKNLPTCQCHICKKHWIFDVVQGKFVEKQ